ncbi:zinc finger protein draculin-like isoform X10 [Coccinella septempunctata]|uniref:zinc finger protein draculin-like isoform X10 n=1 Tax=Coccinella septempunctata TaxID=41139 RepID=UPI001D097E85|nr:zinc finger protein draculin-like isoform X10 [Coccinella septempunctata]
MINSSDILQLCRLCLVEDKVNHPIFEESDDLRSISLKISSCLPVSIHKDDSLPKKICDTCSTKLDSFYQFWSESANAEKQLLQWVDKNKTSKQQADQSRKMETTEVKKELEDTVDPIDMTSEAQTYILQQQQLPYTSSAPNDSLNTSESEEPAAKRPRRASAVKALQHMGSEDEDDAELAADNYAKTESDDSDKEEEDEDSNYQENPSTTSVEDQPGPSGMSKKKMVLDDTPSLEPICQVFVDEDSDNPFCCGEDLSSPNTREKHLKEHEGPKKFTCTECDKKFACKYQLKVHTQTHQETKEYKCTLCERSFKTDKYLENHMNYNHIRGNFRHQCACCDKSYRSEKELNQHVGTKHLGVVYKCEICFKEFYSDMYLKKHMLQHDDSYVPPTVPCSQCDKVFSCKRSLTVHVESFHNGIRHICEICGKSLSTQYSLRLHMRTHSDEKPFECEICGKRFAKSSTRQDHLRIHTKQRPHVCTKCGKGFTQRTPLITHIKSVHGSERPFQCPMCPKAFATKSLLKTHSKVHGKPLGSSLT